MANQTRLQGFVGPTQVFVQAQSSTCPVSANVLNTTNWTQLGFKEKGVTWKIKNKTANVNVEEFTSPVDKWLEEEGITVTVPITQYDISLIQYAISGSTYSPYSAGQYNQMITGGDGIINFFSLAVVGYNKTGKKVVLWVPKVVPGDSFDFNIVKGVNSIPVEFEGMSDTTQAAGARLWQVIELY